MESIIEKLKAGGLRHPVIVALGPRGDITQVFLIVEFEAHVITRGLVTAVDRLVKLQYTMNMEYADECWHILHFLQRFVLDINDNLNLVRGASDLALYIRHHLRS